MKSENFKVVMLVFVILATGVGFLFYKQSVDERLVDTIESITEDEWISAKSHLVLATAIRNNKSTEALIFTEELIVMDVKNFTNDGKNLDELKEYEISTIKQIREYWEKRCDKKCLESISQVLNDERFR